MIERALAAGHEPLSFLMEEKWLPQIQELLAKGCGGDAAGAVDAHGWQPDDIPLFVAPDEVLKKLTGFELTRGALAAFRRPRQKSVEELLSGARLVAVLENITNHTNVGAIFRSAAALGVDAVLVTPACYDPLYRRAVRVSMGTVFQVPWTRIGSEASGTPGHPSAAWADEGIPLLHRLGFKTAALALSDDSIWLDDPQLAREERLAVVLGTEGDGLAPETIARCDYTVKIPMMHGVDSLNVAAASAVAFWELRRR